MVIAEDVTGQRFGRLVAIERVAAPGTVTKWLFACDCGARKLLLLSNVRTGTTKSCGCVQAKKIKAPRLRHGHTEGGAVTNTYRAWAQAKLRLRVTKTRTGRLRPAIPMSPSWKADFTAFLQDMGECPEGHMLARIDRSKGFTPENCEWVPSKPPADRVDSSA